ncbi:hypothetical protein IZU99_02905 [Oscillospiraceae bacterium CM]|nr:hypothetical protein IZU99_02905 [Oscillospiraceae bacterium CM]
MSDVAEHMDNGLRLDFLEDQFNQEMLCFFVRRTMNLELQKIVDLITEGNAILKEISDPVNVNAVAVLIDDLNRQLTAHLMKLNGLYGPISHKI